MEAPRLAVRFYRAASGREPVREFLLALTRETRRAIGVDIKTVQLGWPLGIPLVRKLAPGLWEVRSNTPDGAIRVLFTTRGNDMILLHAFAKKSQKAPAGDLATASKRRDEVLND